MMQLNSSFNSNVQQSQNAIAILKLYFLAVTGFKFVS